MDNLLQQLAHQARSLPMAERAWLVQTLLESLNGRSTGIPVSDSQQSDQLLGQFSDDADFLDQIVEDAMQNRAQQPLRMTDG